MLCDVESSPEGSPEYEIHPQIICRLPRIFTFVGKWKICTASVCLRFYLELLALFAGAGLVINLF